MLDKVCHAPINTYFDITPTGMILNRFSNDINKVDVVIPFSLRAQITNYLILVSAIAVTAYNVIWVLVVIPFILVILIYMLKSFSKTLKEASRMVNVTNSPIITHMNETLNGASTIRTYEKTSEFEQKTYDLLDKKGAALVIRRGAQSWFNTRINLLSTFLMCFSYIYCVSSSSSL